MAGRVAAHVGQLGAGLLEVVVVVVVPARLDALVQFPGVYAFLARHGGLARRVEGDDGAALQRVVRGDDIVAQCQHMLARAVLVVVADALVLHEARDEQEVRLVVLHAVLPGAVGARQALLHGVAVDAQDLVEVARWSV